MTKSFLHVGFVLVLVLFTSQPWANKGTRNAQRVLISTNDVRLGALRELLYRIGGVKAPDHKTVFTCRQQISQPRGKQARALRTVRTRVSLLLTAFIRNQRADTIVS